MQRSERVKEINLGIHGGKRWVRVLKGDLLTGALDTDTEKRILQIRFLHELADTPDIHSVNGIFFQKATIQWRSDHWECELQAEELG